MAAPDTHPVGPLALVQQAMLASEGLSQYVDRYEMALLVLVSIPALYMYDRHSARHEIAIVQSVKSEIGCMSAIDRS
jgi:hypothetical protein